MRINTFLLVAALGLPAIAAADDTKAKATDKAQQAKLTTGDLAIVAHLHHVNVMEIDMGKLAQKQGSAAVKKYGEQLVRDHGTSDKAVLAFAKTRGTTVIPEDKPATEADRKQAQATMDRMTKLRTLKSAADFDREYLSMMVEGHDNELAKTDPAIAAATDPDLKKMLEDRRTTLQRHSDGARELLKANAQANTDKTTSPPKTMSAPK